MLSFDELFQKVEMRIATGIDLELSEATHILAASLLAKMKQPDYDDFFKAAVDKFSKRASFEKMSLYYEALNVMRNNDLAKEVHPALQDMFEIAYWFLKPLESRKLFSHYTKSLAEFECLLQSVGTLTDEDRKAKIERLRIGIAKTTELVDQKHPGLFPHDY